MSERRYAIDDVMLAIKSVREPGTHYVSRVAVHSFLEALPSPKAKVSKSVQQLCDELEDIGKRARELTPPDQRRTDTRLLTLGQAKEAIEKMRETCDDTIVECLKLIFEASLKPTPEEFEREVWCSNDYENLHQNNMACDTKFGDAFESRPFKTHMLCDKEDVVYNPYPITVTITKGHHD